MYFFDEHLGHSLWYIPLFTAYLIYFFGCFSKIDTSSVHLPLSCYVLLLPSTLFNWYLITEGQLIEVFLVTILLMIAMYLWNRRYHRFMDLNGQFFFLQNIVTLFLVLAWVIYLWNDKVLRVKYPGLLYVPEPWAYWSLYLQ